MLLFHEGLPGSGKSYEACIRHIVPALKNGRQVFAYIEGLNHKKFSEVCELPLDEVERLLVQIAEDDVKRIFALVENDALVVIDELQNFWPSGRQRLDDDITKFVTEHRHRGLDILCMGQDLRDCHNLWRRRVSQKVVFTKLDALGMEKRYSWKLYKAVSGEKFEKVSGGTGTYDPKYFGLYASHTANTTNFGNYKDERANLFRTKGFRYGIPFFLGVLYLSVDYLNAFFTDPSMVVGNQAVAAPAPVATPAPPPKVVQPVVAAPAPPPPQEPLTYVEKMAAQYKPRLSAIIENDQGKLFAYVEFVDPSYHVKERFTIPELESMGWEINRTGYGLEMMLGESRIVVRPWPIDPFGAVARTVTTDRNLRSN